MIYSTSESSMWISKQIHFNEIFASAVSVRASEQRFKKLNFSQPRNPFLIKKYDLINLFGVTSRTYNKL
jgi:hypothetical protein